jgi:hypothetical protein
MARCLPILFSVLLPQKVQLAVFLLFLGVNLLRAPLYANSSAEALCEKRHAETLKKARHALTEGKTEEALRFLLEANAISERCARLPELHRGRENAENALASAPSMDLISARMFR